MADAPLDQAVTTEQSTDGRADHTPPYEGVEASRDDEDAIVSEALERYERAEEAMSKNFQMAVEALRFRNLEQWNEKIKKQREDNDQPCLVMDKLNQHINQIVNDGRQNRPGAKVRPKSGGARPKVAEIFQGVIRHIEDCSNADIAYDTAFEAAVDGGFGYWRYVTEYCDETSFEQDIRILRIRNRFSVLLDPDRQQPDGSDAKWGFIFEPVDRKEFEKQWPEKDPCDFRENSKNHPAWAMDKYLLVAEYFCYENTSYELVLLDNGMTMKKEDYDAAPDGTPNVYRGPGLKWGIKKQRTTTKEQVVWRKLTCKDVLEKRDWMGKYIPIVEVVGHELDIEGEVILKGCVTPAMDPMRVHNYASSAFVENVALAPKAPWVADAESIAEFATEWKSANKSNVAVLRYKARMEGDQMVPAPQRVTPPQPATGWAQALQFTEHDVQASLGRYAASLGEVSNERSGRAITARSRESDVGSYHFADNMKRSTRHGGHILVDLIPKVMDTRRITRIIMDDGEVKEARLDPHLKEAMLKIQLEGGQEGEVYNLNIGTYDVAITAGPSYTTQRQESVDAMFEVLKAQPELIKIIGDLMFKNMDWPGAQEISDRLKKMLPPQLLDEADNPLTPVVKQLQQQIQGIMHSMEAQTQQVKVFDALTKRIKATSDARLDEAKIREIAAGIATDIMGMLTPAALPAEASTAGQL